MLPAFWVADGSYRARGTSSNGGTIFFDLGSVLALGASSGGGGGGDTTDPNSIFSTGMPVWMPTSGLKSGWIRMNGRTIGSATSGATERANSDTQTLFEYLWNNYIDAFCAVVSGRGASSAADWAANKQITPLDMRRRSAFGVAGMGNTALTDFDTLTFTIGGVDTPASQFGASTKALVTANLPPYTPLGSVSSPSIVTHIRARNDTLGGGATEFATTLSASGGTSTASSALTSNPLFTGTAQGGTSTAFDKMPPSMLGTWYMKL